MRQFSHVAHQGNVAMTKLELHPILQLSHDVLFTHQHPSVHGAVVPLAHDHGTLAQVAGDEGARGEVV